MSTEFAPPHPHKSAFISLLPLPSHHLTLRRFIKGAWGNHQLATPQKYIAVYGVAQNRQKPLAGTLHAAIFNTFRRSRNQFLYVVPPFVAAFLLMEWAEERYVLYLLFVG